jgi:hypothetical protein
MTTETPTAALPVVKDSLTPQTDTPRTDASKVDKGGMTFVWSEFAQELERELAASKAEVERLQTLPESRHKAFLDLLERAEKAEAEVKEIRNALGDDGRRTHKELIQLATKAAEWRNWKEKYTALRNAHIAEGQDPAGTIWEHADKIQQELKASKAEIKKLKESK